MEIHSVLPEERARDSRGETLPWGYRSARSARQPEESGPFGRNRSLRATGSRTPRARTGTTPVRQKENSAVAEFGRLFAKEQAKEEEKPRGNLGASSGASGDSARPIELEAVPTECLIHGYSSKSVEWKVLSKFEKIVSPGFICEDYPREDPNLAFSSGSPSGFAVPSSAGRQRLSQDAIRKSRIYNGGQHWIKVTFDSYQAAERACFFSPVDIDGFMVHCETWQGRGPATDVALPRGFLDENRPLSPERRVQSPPSGRPSHTQPDKDTTMAGFERALQTLPRSHTMPDVQYAQPFDAVDDNASLSSATASSATATASNLVPSSSLASGLRSRSVPMLPSQATTSAVPSDSDYMTHIKVKKAVLRPISEALPPQPTFAERILMSIPIVSWFTSAGVKSRGPTELPSTSKGIIGEGPLLKENGTWDANNGWYWTFWHTIDQCLGTDFCGLVDE